jgi:FMN phosphatase YigB (HAD superfamily)
MTGLQAVFFDLDGTLLDVDMGAFLPEYLTLVSRRVAGIMPPDRFVAYLLRATNTMVANDGAATNEAVFWAAFSPLTGYDRKELEPTFAAFYEEDFPQLQRLARPRPDARKVVETAMALGLDVVIATNPVFPETAIRQRIAWAGLADLPFRWVTTYENSRFCKPNVRYFEALAAEVGRPPEACLVVGDEEMDMVAAHGGHPTFLTASATTNLSPETPAPTYRGELSDVEALLRQRGWRM